MNDMERLEMQQPPEHDKALAELAKIYHDLCDTFDRRVCGNKEGIPQTATQFAMVNRNAKRVRDEVRERAARIGIDAITLALAIVQEAREREKKK